MKQHSIDKFFTNKMFRRQYFPALIAAVVLSFGDIADGLVLGNSSVGYIGLAAIALTMPVVQIINVIMNGLGIGGSVRFSQQMARGEKDQAVADFKGMFYTTALLGVIIAVLGNVFIVPMLGVLGAGSGQEALFDASMTYLRILLAGTPMIFLNYLLNYYMKNDDLEKKASIAFTVGNIVDIALNIILVLVFRFGVAGASIATIAGQTTGMIMSIIFIVRHKGALKFFPFKPDFRHVASSFGKGFFSSIEYLYSMVFLLLANRLLLKTTGDIGVAVLEVVLSISYFMINFCDAASKSSLPVVSTYCGERNESGMRLALRTGMLYALITGAALAAVVLIFPDQICRFFGLTELEMLDAGRGALRWYACCIPIAAASIMFGGFYEARTQERDTLVLSSLRGILPIVLALIFTFFAPEQFWLLFPISEGGALLVFALYKLIASRPPFDRSRVFSKTIYSRNMEISETTEQIEEFCAKWDTPVKQQYFAAMALEEICVAMLDNGFRGKEDGFIQITLIVPEEGGLELHIRDNAASFNPLAMQMTSENDGEIDMNALGVEAIKKKSKDFSYRHYQGFNTVIIRI